MASDFFFGFYALYTHTIFLFLSTIWNMAMCMPSVKQYNACVCVGVHEKYFFFCPVHSICGLRKWERKTEITHSHTASTACQAFIGEKKHFSGLFLDENRLVVKVFHVLQYYIRIHDSQTSKFITKKEYIFICFPFVSLFDFVYCVNVSYLTDTSAVIIVCCNIITIIIIVVVSLFS